MSSLEKIFELVCVGWRAFEKFGGLTSFDDCSPLLTISERLEKQILYCAAHGWDCEQLRSK
jgi:hypothetical protein